MSRFIQLRRAIKDIWSVRPESFFVLAAAAYLLVHFRAVFMTPYFDDWPIIEMTRASIAHDGVLAGLAKTIVLPTGDFWRPLHVLLSAPVIGESAAISQILKLAAVVMVCNLLARLARLVAAPPPLAWLAAITLLLHQCMVLGGEVDRWGDVILTASLVGTMIAALQYEQSIIGVRKYAITTALWCLAGLMSKEAGVIGPFLNLAFAFTAQRYSLLRRGHVLTTIVSLAVAGLYLLARICVGVGFSSSDPTGVYRLSIGSNIFQNIGLISFALLTPISTIKMVIGGLAWIWLGISLAAVWALLILRGITLLIPTDRLRYVLLLALFFVLVQGPSLLMGKISEPNIARSLPFGILLSLLALKEVWNRSGAGKRAALMTFVAVTLLAHVGSSWSKVSHLVEVSQRARCFRDAVSELMPAPPPRPIVFHVARTYHGYSCYVQPLWRSVLGDADSGMRLRYGSSDYATSILILDSLSSPLAHDSDPDFVLDAANLLTAADGRSIQVYPIDQNLQRWRLGDMK